MNKLADEQSAPEASQDQPASDFYARITPDNIIRAWLGASVEMNHRANILLREIGRTYDGTVAVPGLLAMLESAERRAAEADRKARQECAAICARKSIRIKEYNKYSSSAAWAAVMVNDCEADILNSITHGNLSENRETLASGDMPPGGASE